jgi:hypothetical protein
MTKLLHSRWTLPCALVVALAVWIGDLRSPQGSTATAGSRRSVEPPSPEVSDAVGLGELSIRDALREWLVQQSDQVETRLREDPFLDWKERHVPQPATTGAVTVLPVLRGISLGAGRPLAILDRTVIGEGETLGPWTVETIETDNVWITGPSGKVGLTLARDPVLLPLPKSGLVHGSNTPFTHAPSTSPQPAPRK